ncbi:hypothetical protein [Corallococcus llansteffanensis]|uniref:Uncharacterized protein n=1 Tax=Corallococcus llansteffanensis TaxID=2316731 RepID=A0A3A8N8W7_9BACT|nr:hypothetical protein [Corallococcus llansteffanensis]RKH39900.1 hypothetical protein D7V93_39955 [Corallococcus llansteffanensis]
MPSRPASPEAPSSSFLTDVSRFLGAFRWAFMPMGLLALVAVGVHAAADTLDDRLLTAVDRLDSVFDGFVGQYPATASLVDWVSLETRTRLARALTLAWELAADLLLALPALGYREVAAPAPREAWRTVGLSEPSEPSSWKALLQRCLRRPTSMRWVRPLATAGVVLAGACTVARLVQGTVYLSWRPLFGDTVADLSARGLAVAALCGVSVSLGWRAVLRNLQHADAACAAVGPRRAWTRGLLGCVLVAPLGLAAVWDAAPVLSFLR